MEFEFILCSSLPVIFRLDLLAWVPMGEVALLNPSFPVYRVTPSSGLESGRVMDSFFATTIF
jgi:hypothetical protein